MANDGANIEVKLAKPAFTLGGKPFIAIDSTNLTQSAFEPAVSLGRSALPTRAYH